MIFKFHTAFALGLIAMVAGMYLVMKARSAELCCTGFAKVVGWFVVITAFLGLICSTYYSFSYMNAGYYCPSKMGCDRHMMMKHHGRGRGMRGDYPSMKEGMEKPPRMKMMEEDEGDDD